jgi:hypothetical protein
MSSRKFDATVNPVGFADRCHCREETVDETEEEKETEIEYEIENETETEVEYETETERR